MKVQVTAGKLKDVRADALGVGLFQGAKRPEGEAAALDKALGGLISRLIKAGDFEGKAGQTALLYPEAPVRAKRLVLVGLGKREELTLEGFRKAAGHVAKLARRVGARSLAFSLDGTDALEEPRAEAAQAAAEAAILATYTFDEYKTDEEKKDKKPLATLTLVAPDRRGLKAVKAASAEGRTIAEAACFARRLVDLPGNTHTPTYLAREARRLARASRKLTVRVLGRPQMERLKMGALLSVAKGSSEPPRFIVLEYKGGRARQAPVVLVGKAVTFDSGGISIKPSQAMEEMKRDMAGGAAVLGAIKAVAALKLPLNVVGLVPATENLPSGTAFKPGDIITASSGTTIEILNTDAEGRLILADALTYAKRYKPAACVDLATLTGACEIALGKHCAGLMGTDEALIEEVKEAGEACGERAWPLPLWPEYHEQIKSDVADVKNIGGRGGGAITAAAFLAKFAEGYPWAHLDIAATSWVTTDLPYIPKGATGYGVRLMVEFLKRRAASS